VIIDLIGKFLPESNRFERIWKIAQVDFKSRYYNNRLGVYWALIFPLFKLLCYYTVFTIISPNTPKNFALFIFSGLLIWMMFAECTKRSLTLINRKKYLMQNIQFNHFDLFISHVITVIMGFNYNVIAYFIFSLFGHVYLGFNALFFPVILLTVILYSYSVSIILATLSGFFEDIKHLWDMIILAGFWGSGIFYETEKITNIAPIIMYLNPFLGIIENTRNCILYNESPNFVLLNYNLMIAIILTIFASNFYKRKSHKILENL